MSGQPGLFDEQTTAALRKAAAAPIVQGLPDHVKRRLEAMGLMDPDTGATRRAKARRCQGCGRSIMRGIDEDWGGQSSDADPSPLSRLGEAMAVCLGRKTFELAWTGGRGYELSRRNASRIRGRPSGTQGMDVLAGHICGDMTIFDNAVTRINDNSAPAAALPDNPPF